MTNEEPRLDPLSPIQRSERMSRVRSGNTKPELVVRRMVHAMGYRYRIHGKRGKTRLPGSPDLVFGPRRKVVFVHGCFWHRHEGCPNDRPPKSRQDFWLPKLEANRQRDEVNLKLLCELGWESLVVWECELKNLPALEERLRTFIEGKAGRA